MKKNKKDYCPPPPSKEEAEQKAKYDEFWSDPCWTEPLPLSDEERMEIAALMSKL